VNVRVTRFAGVGCALLIGTATAATAATPPLPPGPIEPINGNGSTPAPATAALSSTKAGAKPVELVVKLRYTMVCGQPGPGTAVIMLPAAADVPARIARSAALVNGKPAAAVSVAGNDVTISIPLKRPGVSCMIVGPGTLTLTLTRAAGIGNPEAAGTYTIRIRRKTRTFTTSVAISA
jgi:hypothetical protein